MPTWQSLYRTPKRFCLQLCLNYTALPPEVFSNLTGLLPELMIPVLCLSTSLSEPAVFRSASSVHGSQNPQRSVTPSWYEASKTFNLKSNTLLQNASTTYIHNIYMEHTQTSIQHRIMQEKLLCYILTNGKCMYLTMVFLSSLWLLSSTLAQLN
jgi:hypothetical protein